jgi:hypothetical protein
LQAKDIANKNIAFFFPLSTCLTKRANLTSFFDGLFKNEYQVRPLYDIPECICPWRNVAKHNINTIEKLACANAPGEFQKKKNQAFGSWGTLTIQSAELEDGYFF